MVQNRGACAADRNGRFGKSRNVGVGIESPPLEFGQRNPVVSPDRITQWLKIALLVLVVWLLVEKLASYFVFVGYAALIAIGGLFLAYLVYPLVRSLHRRLA